MRHTELADQIEATPTLSLAEAVRLADEAVRAAAPGRIRLVAEIRKPSRWGRGGRPMCFLELADADASGSRAAEKGYSPTLPALATALASERFALPLGGFVTT